MPTAARPAPISNKLIGSGTAVGVAENVPEIDEVKLLIDPATTDTAGDTFASPSAIARGRFSSDAAMTLEVKVTASGVADDNVRPVPCPATKSVKVPDR